ncbi:hypothetical protein [Microbispora sp. KK1-11]|uniref:hypothetical protein n=1 Tax=Microbispora sp. KK1-11 TaxID=2053005 RepID=UPI0021AFE782|nr:hypothetical protein [Microbispora sp. KK1-11]
MSKSRPADGVRYFRREWDEDRGDEYAHWGTCTVMELSDLEGLRLVSVTAALFTHRSDAPELLHVWLRLETTTVVVRDTADWALRITPDEPEESYAMEELGSRVDIVPAPAEVPFVRHVGERLVRVTKGFDAEDPARWVEAEFVFETGRVIAEAFGGDLRLSRGPG